MAYCIVRQCYCDFIVVRFACSYSIQPAYFRLFRHSDAFDIKTSSPSVNKSGFAAEFGIIERIVSDRRDKACVCSNQFCQQGSMFLRFEPFAALIRDWRQRILIAKTLFEIIALYMFRHRARPIAPFRTNDAF